MFESQYSSRIQAVSASWVRGLQNWLAYYLRKINSIETLFVMSCIALALYFLLALFAIEQDQSAIPAQDDDVDWHDKVTTIALPKDYKYILLWSWRAATFAPFYKRGEGRETFLAINCSVNKCYVTADRRLFGGDITKYHALLFHDQGFALNSSDLPRTRSHHQIYIFYSMESAGNYPVCDKVFDGFFNWTSTYRLDSDIPCPYILIRDHNGKIVGPKRKIRWKKMVAAVDDDVIERIKNKNRAVAWFASHLNCKTKSGRLALVQGLRNALIPYGFTVDVFGKCGTYHCPKFNQSICNDLVRLTYYFYLSLENSFAVDYVTEKLRLALQIEVVPIVYGGADYTRFLPPGSYIDARNHSISELASKLNRLIHTPEEYRQYFWWKKYYSYHNPTSVENVCAICEALHNEKMLNTTKTYNNFRKWWNPTMESCSND